MAPAALPSRNEPCWGEPKVYARRHSSATTTTTVAASAANYRDTKNNNIPKCNNPPLFQSKPNPNPNKETRAHDPTSNVHFKKTPTPAQPQSLPESDYVTFNLGAYTRRELKDLRKRLVSDLERVRNLGTRIANSDFQATHVYPTTKSQNRGGSKRANPFGNPKAKRAAAGTPSLTSTKNAMRRCGEILTKLMKDKQGWAFNTPVDVVSLRLRDYHDIIKKPMDLGTVRSKLENNVYKCPQEFAEDVRLTFNNALVYNPKGHYVYAMAETLSAKFEQMFQKLSKQQQRQGILVNKEEEAALVRGRGKGRGKAREMSLEEKMALGRSLEELPQEELGKLLGIVKKRSSGNGSLSCHGDEIELDIEALDNDTLWQLVRFVDNFKKAEKDKTEKEPMCSQVAVAVAAPVVIERSKKGNVAAEEEVDIGEEIPVQNYPPVVIERDDASSGTSTSSTDSEDSSSSTSSGIYHYYHKAQALFIYFVLICLWKY